jgi:YHS domain-containing protein
MKVTRLLSVFVLVLFAAIAVAQDEPSINGTKKADRIFQHDGFAIRGYDPVAYFTDGKPVRGKKEFEFEYNGARWLFASAANQQAFSAEPEKYLPQYGGYCAYGMSHGYAAPIEPDAWSIVDGKLYLNYNLDVRKEWNKDIPGYISKADVNWPKIPKK